MSPSATTATKGNGISKSSNTSEINVAVHTEQKPAFNSHGSKTHKLPVLRDATQRAVGIYRARLGSASEQFLTSCQTVETFFDVLAGIRLRQMPHSSSRWDKVLKWAEFFALQVQGCSEEASLFEDYAEKASCIIWASMLSMLQVFSRFHILTALLTLLYSWDQSTFPRWKKPLVSFIAADSHLGSFYATMSCCTLPRSCNISLLPRSWIF